MVSEAAIAIDQRYLGTKTAEGLREFQSDITCAEHEEMLRDLIEFQRLDMCERPRPRPIQESVPAWLASRCR